MKPKKIWYGIANFKGGYTFSHSYSALLEWKREDNISGVIKEIPNEEYKRLKRHKEFIYFNDFLTLYP